MPTTVQQDTINSTNVIFILSFQICGASGLGTTEVWEQLDKVNLIDSNMNLTDSNVNLNDSNVT
jgi:hypothetical protein